MPGSAAPVVAGASDGMNAGKPFQFKAIGAI